MEDEYMAEDQDTGDMPSQGSMFDSDEEDAASNLPTPTSRPPFSSPVRHPRERELLSRGKSRSSTVTSHGVSASMAHTNLPSAPASPPTPAPSPSPRHRLPDWSTADESEELNSSSLRGIFRDANEAQRRRFLTEVLNMCNTRDLTFVHDIVCPRLKKDPFTVLPDELCLRILTLVDKARTLGRAAQVSRRWHDLVSDDMTWKIMNDRYSYRRPSNDSDNEGDTPRASPTNSEGPAHPYGAGRASIVGRMLAVAGPLRPSASNSAPDLTLGEFEGSPGGSSSKSRGAKYTSYRSHFKRRFMVETAWRSGGIMHSRHITPDQGVVTSLHLTPKYIVVALDNAKIHVFDANGAHQKTLHGHMMGVWAMVPWGDTLVSGGCDRDVRVWNMATGQNVHVLRGHSSTVRCLKMVDSKTAVTGSRDTTLRVWDIEKGQCKHIMIGHQASVRCVEVHGDLVASGSYDTTARIWSISQGRCLRTLQGHFSQIYAIAFDGRRVATGSLDTSVRVWNPHDGTCLGVLQGHTSLVGQLQMRGDTLITGGSDGSVRVWSLEKLAPIHRLAAHDNSVTSLQFNESRIVSGGSDGRVKVWDLKTGTLVRELSQPAEAVWRVVFEEEKAIIMANRAMPDRTQRTIMEVWSFAPPKEPVLDRSRSQSTSETSTPDRSLRQSIDDPSDQDVVMSDDTDASHRPSARRKMYTHAHAASSAG